MKFPQSVVDDHISDLANIGLDVLDTEFRTGHRLIGGRAEDRKIVLVAQLADFSVKRTSVHQHADRVVFDRAWNGRGFQIADNRMIHIAGRNRSKGQTVILAHRFDDIAPPLVDHMKFAVNFHIADHCIPFFGGTPFRIENLLKAAAELPEHVYPTSIGIIAMPPFFIASGPQSVTGYIEHCHLSVSFNIGGSKEWPGTHVDQVALRTSLN